MVWRSFPVERIWYIPKADSQPYDHRPGRRPRRQGAHRHPKRDNGYDADVVALEGLEGPRRQHLAPLRCGFAR
jgi:hypothetical protein